MDVSEILALAPGLAALVVSLFSLRIATKIREGGTKARTEMHWIEVTAAIADHPASYPIFYENADPTGLSAHELFTAKVIAEMYMECFVAQPLDKAWRWRDDSLANSSFLRGEIEASDWYCERLGPLAARAIR